MQDPRFTHRDLITTAPTSGINVISDEGEGVDIYRMAWAVFLALVASGLKLDDLAAPDDNTDLDASAAKHGLMSKAAWSKLNAIEANADVTDGANVGAAIAAGAAKTLPVDDDRIGLIDSEASNVLKTVTLEVIKAFVGASLALTGTPTVPTAAPGTNTTQAASTAFVQAALAALAASAPDTLDTLNELAAALGNDPNFATTITNLIAAKVAATRAVNTSGLASGGGDLSADRTINVPAASQAEAEAGSNNTKAMTPLRVAQAIEALGGGGGGPELTGVVWVSEDDGDDSTGDGTAGAPYATLQAAYDERWAGGARAFVVHGHVGNLVCAALPHLNLISFGLALTSVGSIVVATSDAVMIRGNGPGMIQVDDITVQPAAASSGNTGTSSGESGTGGSDGTHAGNLYVEGLNVQNSIILKGGNGGPGGGGGPSNDETNPGNGGNGGNGGNAGVLTVKHCRVGTIIQSEPGVPGNGGNGGDGGASYTGGNGGDGGFPGSEGSVYVTHTECGSYAEATVGLGGGGGSGGTGFGTGFDGASQSGGSGSGTVDLQFSALSAASPTANVTARFCVIGGTAQTSLP